MRSARDVRWRMAPEVSADVESLVRAVGVTPLTARLLCNRGVSGEDVSAAVAVGFA